MSNRGHWAITLLTAAAFIAALVFLKTGGFGIQSLGVQPVPEVTLVTAVEFAPPVEWPFRVKAASPSAARAAVDLFIQGLKQELAARNVRLDDERGDQGCLILTVKVPKKTKPLLVRMTITGDVAALGAGDPGAAVAWSGGLYADIATCENLIAADKAAVRKRLDELAAEVRAAADAAAAGVPEINPGP